MTLTDLQEKGYLSEQDLFEMANVDPSESGLDIFVFVSPKGGARHGPRVKVCNTRGKMNASDVFTLTIPGFQVIGICKLEASILDDVKDWVRLNKDLIIQYWGSSITTGELFQSLQKI